jgi:hypothetical protein
MNSTLSILVTIITSAAVGSLVSAIVQYIGAARERQARRKELLLARALDLAHARNERKLRIADAAGGATTLSDDIYLAEFYFEALSHLMDHGTLPRMTQDLQESFSLKQEKPELPTVEGTPMPGGRPRRR